MKKILIIFYCLMTSLVFGDKITVVYPQNKMGYHFYADLVKNEYSGTYADLLNSINKDKKYEFDYKLSENNDGDIQLRRLSNFNSKYYYLETPFTQQIFILGDKNINLEDLSNIKNINIGCLGIGVQELEKIINSLDISSDRKFTVFKNEKDAFYALFKNKIDILLITNYKQSNTNSNIHILGSANLKEYIGIRKDRTDLYGRIKNELNLLFSDNNKLLNTNTENRRNYLNYLYSDSLEYEYVKNTYSTLKVLVPSKDFLPYYKKKLFKEIGVVPHIMKNIEELLNIPVEYVFSEDDDWDIQAVDFSNNNQTLSREYYRAKIAGISRIYDINITKYYHLNGLRLIKLKNMNMGTVLDKINYKQLIEVDSLDEAFKLLKDNQGDVILGPYFLLNHYLLSNKYDKDFKISQSKFEIPVEMTFKDKVLKKIVERKLINYSEDEIEFIVNQSLAQDKPLNIWLILTDILIVLFTIFLLVYVRKYIVKRKLNSFVSLIVKIEKINSFKDSRSLIHAKNVADLSKLIAKELHLKKSRILTLEKLGLIHDIGLAFIPQGITQKKLGTIPIDEEDSFEEHTLLAELLLKGIGINYKKRRILKYHHENIDGSGYLKVEGKKLPIESKILRVADIYDRIIASGKISHSKALEILETKKNIYFDPEVVDIVFKLKDEIIKIYSEKNQTKTSEELLKEFREILAK